MTDMLESVRDYICPPLVDADVEVISFPVYRLSIALDNNVEALWQPNDFTLAENYAERFVDGSVPPAIVISGTTVVDGFHRLWAYRKLNRRCIPAIDLAVLKRKINSFYDDV